MIFFKDVPTDEEAMHRLHADLKARLRLNGDTNGYTDDELSDLIERGAALAIATMRGMDEGLRKACEGLNDADGGVVQSVALMQIAGTAKHTIQMLLMQSFLHIILGRRPS